MTLALTAPMKASLENMRRRELDNAEAARPAAVVETYLSEKKTRVGLYARGYIIPGNTGYCTFVLTPAGRDYADELMAGKR